MIFFYPDADNLERQWQTITEDDDESSKSTVTDAWGLGSNPTKLFMSSQVLGFGVGKTAVAASATSGFMSIPVADVCLLVTILDLFLCLPSLLFAQRRSTLAVRSCMSLPLILHRVAYLSWKDFS